MTDVRLYLHVGAPDPAWTDLLGSGERKRYEGMTHEAARGAFLAGRALARLGLSEAHPGTPPGGWRFQHGPHGKPYATPNRADGPRFNIAHTTGLVTCVVSSGPMKIGVDVERADRPVSHRRLAARYFDAREVESLAGLDDGEARRRFIDLWLLKESWLKALGIGIAGNLGNAAFVPDGPDRYCVAPDCPEELRGSDVRFWLGTAAEEFRLAVAVVTRAADPVLQIHAPGEVPISWERAFGG